LITVHIALLRAVNVGGRVLKMAELAAFARDMGLENPSTLLQSGNLVFESSGSGGEAVERRLESEAAARFGFPIDFVLRTADEWRAIIADNPFTGEARDDPAHLLVMPLKSAPARGALEALRAAIKGPERAEIVGRDAYLVYPAGIGASKLTITVIERHLGVRGTARNWNTVMKLAAMARI
jgi:uncharacterized protein (DUF1697 family)